MKKKQRKLFCVIALVFLVLSFSVSANAKSVIFREIVQGVGEFISKLGKHDSTGTEKTLKLLHSSDGNQFSNGKGLSEIVTPADEAFEKGLQEGTTSRTAKVFRCALANPTVQESVKKIVEKSSEEIVNEFLKTLQNEIENSKPENCK